MSLSISLFIASIIESILTFSGEEEGGCIRSSLFLLSPSYLPLSLATVSFISTSMASFIMPSRETDLLLLNHKVNSLSKASTYWSWDALGGGLNQVGISLYTFINMSENSWTDSLFPLLMEWNWDKKFLGSFFSSHWFLKAPSKS